MDDKDTSFQPDGFEVSLRDDGQFVKIAFDRDDGETREVVVPRGQLPALLASLAKKVEPGQLATISPDAIQFGETFRVQGLDIQKSPDGSAVLRAHVELPDQDRIVVFPLSMSPADVAFILERLTD